MSTASPAPHVPAPPKLPGVIETLSAGFRMLNQHLYLLLVPVILDLFYWLGPRLSVQAVAQQTAQAVEQIGTAPGIGVTTTQATDSLKMLVSTIEAMGKDMNLFSVLSGALSIPSLLVSQGLQPPAGSAVAEAYGVASFAEMLWLASALFVLGVAIGALYLGFAAQVVRDGRARPGVLAQRLMSYAVRYIGLLLLLIVMLLVAGLPASLIVGLLTLISPLLGAVLMFVVWAAAFWLYFNLFFAINALFVSEVGPLGAIISSVTVVRLSTSSVIGLFMIMMVISWGMSYIWSALGTSTLAVLAAIVGNAYIGSGLTVASMIFYRDRITAIKSRLVAASSQTPAG